MLCSIKINPGQKRDNMHTIVYYDGGYLTDLQAVRVTRFANIPSGCPQMQIMTLYLEISIEILYLMQFSLIGHKDKLG